jgi:hypothetical protein
MYLRGDLQNPGACCAAGNAGMVIARDPGRGIAGLGATLAGLRFVSIHSGADTAKILKG